MPIKDHYNFKQLYNNFYNDKYVDLENSNFSFLGDILTFRDLKLSPGDILIYSGCLFSIILLLFYLLGNKYIQYDGKDF
jgi:hypothetical protein